MEIMDLSTLKPEEKIRQGFIRFLEENKVPASLMVIEKTLSELPHLFEEASLPLRRIDLLVYKKQEDKLLPLLLVECKAKELSEKALHQVLGYNFYIKAPYIALVSQKGLGIFDIENKQWIKNHVSFFKQHF